MPRRVTQEEGMRAWTQFASAALAGLLANPEFSEVSGDETARMASDCADVLLEKWEAHMETALEIDEEVAEEEAAEKATKEMEMIAAQIQKNIEARSE